MNNPRWFVPALAALIFFQAAWLGSVLYSKQTILNDGQAIRLKTRPLDPRSLLSGDYVVLDYEISRPGSKEKYHLEQTVFVVLKPDKSGRWFNADQTFTSLDMARSHGKSAGGEFAVIRGTVSRTNPLTLHYGIEQFFVPQHEGHYLERNMRNMTVEVLLSDEGLGVIKQVFIKDKAVKFNPPAEQ